MTLEGIIVTNSAQLFLYQSFHYDVSSSMYCASTGLVTYCLNCHSPYFGIWQPSDVRDRELCMRGRIKGRWLRATFAKVARRINEAGYDLAGREFIGDNC